ncbi:MAG: proton-conducting transporter membrane subunit [Labilithrix sp.]
MITIPSIVWLACVFGLPLACVLLSKTGIGTVRLRFTSIAIATVLTAGTTLPFFWAALRGFHVDPPSFMPGTGALLRLDELSLVLPALAAGLWLFTIVVTPTVVLGADGLRFTAQSTLFTLATFLTEHPLVLALAWAGSVAALRGAFMTTRSKKRHFAGVYLGVSTILFASGAVLLTLPTARGSALDITALGLLVAGAMIRKGIFPAHAWVPAMFEHGRLGPSILFSSPQVGTYAVAVLVVPRAPAELLRVVAILSLFTGVYAAAQAIVQRSARRVCAYLFVSQSALVMAGLDSTSHEALTGALVLWLASSVSFAGLGRCLVVLEARRGELDLARYHGAYERKPLLAAAFLVLGLSYSGFPGTLGFVGEELLLGGAVGAFPWLGFLVVASSALIGIAVLRMYFSIFTGRSLESPMVLKPSEAVGFVAVAAVLVLTGLVPAPLVASRERASAHLIMERTLSGVAVLVDHPAR